MLHQEAARTSEFVGALGNHRHRQFFAGQIRVGSLEKHRLTGVFVDDRGGLGVRCQLLQWEESEISGSDARRAS